MAIVLTLVASVMCTVTMLTPARLTALARNAVGNVLDARVEIGSIDWDIDQSTGRFTLTIDSVTILSNPMLRLPASERGQIPAWADTLLTLRRFEGGISVIELLKGRIDLHDVAFDRPYINLYQLNDSLSNYLIYKFDETDTVPIGPLPDISINSFKINNPGPLRFHNHATGEHFELRLNSLSINGTGKPRYAIDMGGKMDSPSLSLYNIDHLDFGVHGNMAWNPAKPTEIDLRNFLLRANFITARTSAIVDFGRDILVRDYALSLDRTPIASLVAMMPDSLRNQYGIDSKQFDTDCAIAFDLRSNAPFNLATDSVPHANLKIEILPGALRYGKARFDNFSGTISAQLHGNDLDRATFEASDINLAGPATTLTLNAQASEVMTDPLLEGSLKAKSNLGHLPQIVNRLAQGYLSGHLTADLNFVLRQSMMQPDKFHKINLKGQLTGRDLYYLSADTANMVMIYGARLKFGTHTATVVDSLLKANISVDSARILHTQYAINLADLQLGVGVSNRARSADTTVVVPMGGDLKLGKFYMTVLGDSMAVNMRDAHGRLTLNRFKANKHRPVLGLNIDVARISTGSPDMRFLLSKAHIETSAVKRDRPRVSRTVQRAVDSIRAVAPHLPMDSIYARAIAHTRHRRGRYPRVHPEITDSSEIIDWGTSKTLRDILLNWDVRGRMTARRAGVYTPCFPLRNRVRNFNMDFTNDSLIMSDIEYKAGHSDFLVSGIVSNIRRGFTSRGFRAPVKIEFVVLSDTIDVNQLADATFRGSAYIAARNKPDEGRPKSFSLNALEHDEMKSDEALERDLGKIVANAPDSLAPLLVPKNIEADIRIHSDNVLYSDLNFNDFNGQLLASRGALNLHDLTAASSMGTVNLSALYSSESVNDLKFGFGLEVERFNINRFIKLVPAVDSIMPLLRDLSGIIDADIAATCGIDRKMNLRLPTLEAAMHIAGDSLAIVDQKTYSTLAKWLMFKNKRSNIIDHMNVEMTVKDNVMHLYPFIFDLDRYRIGVQGYNDLDLNFKYHLAVLKSPLPFKFGVTVSGNPDKYKVRLGKARLTEKQAMTGTAIVDTARINLLDQIEYVFKRGLASSRFARLDIDSSPVAADINLANDTLTHADSLVLIREGLIPAPDSPQAPVKQSVLGKAWSRFREATSRAHKHKSPTKQPSEATLPKHEN